MTITEAVKKGFSQAKNLLNVIAIFFAFNAVIGLISLPLTDPAKADDPGTMGISLLATVIFFFAFIFLQGGALGMVKDQIKTATVNMSEFVNYGKKFYLRILLLLVIYLVIAFIVVLLLSLVSAGLLLLGSNIVIRFLVAAIITVVAIVLITLLVYPIYVVALEDTGAIEALKKGVMTAKNNFKGTLGLFIIMLLVSLAISLIVGVVVGFATAIFPENITRIIMAIVNAAVQSYIPIVMMIAFMSFYAGLSTESSAPSPSEPQAPVSEIGGDQG